MRFSSSLRFPLLMSAHIQHRSKQVAGYLLQQQLQGFASHQVRPYAKFHRIHSGSKLVRLPSIASPS